MQAIEALLIGVEEPHDYLHIKQKRMRSARGPGRSHDGGKGAE
jgi:hypothetical protein